MPVRSRFARLAFAILVFGAALGAASCQWSKRLRLASSSAEQTEDPFDGECALASSKSMMALARDLDHIEKHIEQFGSVVPKIPDVWGQARLQKHREDFEEQMQKDLDQFEVRINGAVARADSSFIAQAVALGQAISGPGATTPAAPSVNIVSQMPASGTNAANAVIPMDANATPLLDPATRFKINPAHGQSTAVGLEPTLILQQKERYLNLLNQIRRTNEGDDTADSPGYSLNLMRIPVSLLPGKRTDQGWGADITFTLTPQLSADLLPMTFRNLVINDLVDQLGFPLVKVLEEPTVQYDLATSDRNEFLKELEKADEETGTIAKSATQTKHARMYQGVRFAVAIPALPPSKGVQARSPFPNSQIIDVYGAEFAYTIAKLAYDSFQDEIKKRGYAHLPDIQAFLQAELDAAYRYLAEPANQQIWSDFCTPTLVKAIRDRNIPLLVYGRKIFRERFKHTSDTLRNKNGCPAQTDYPMQFSVTAALAWCILVDSALLTDRLEQDMREAASAKGYAPITSPSCDYAYPNPSLEARQAFVRYVKLRWPIHVFALDPENQDQNLADSLSTRRETQLTLALAFVSGKINANTLTRYSRRLEATYDTIALNRTQVGFSHEDRTFGWRFYPRFQTPDTEPNLTIIARDQLIGGPSRDALLRQRRLEPGPRECVAIVLMPSFVPYLKCESVSNWFSLVNPKHKAFDLTQAMRISHSIKLLQDNGGAVKDVARFRLGDHERLMTKLSQLDARMPTQTQRVQVPILNTLGGFKMFNNGTTDFAPELYGFYGAPGVTLAAAAATKPASTPAPGTITINTTHSTPTGAATPAGAAKPAEAAKATSTAAPTGSNSTSTINTTITTTPTSAAAPTATPAATIMPPTTAGAPATATPATTVPTTATPATTTAAAKTATSTINTGVTLFLVGEHFSVNRTKVIVGNYEAAFEMLSRQVLKVAVPAALVPIDAKNVHVHVATPYGVSREIRIPVISSVKPAAGYSLKPNLITVNHDGKTITKFDAKQTVSIVWGGDAQAGAVTADLQFVFTKGSAQVVVPQKPMPIVFTNGAAEIDAKTLTDTLKDLPANLQITADQFLAQSAGVIITPTKSSAVTTLNPLQIRFIKDPSPAPVFKESVIGVSYAIDTNNKPNVSGKAQAVSFVWNGDATNALKGNATVEFHFTWMGKTIATFKKESVMFADGAAGPIDIAAELNEVLKNNQNAIDFSKPQCLAVDATINYGTKSQAIDVSGLEIKLSPAPTPPPNKPNPKPPEKGPNLPQPNKLPTGFADPKPNQLAPRAKEGLTTMPKRSVPRQDRLADRQPVSSIPASTGWRMIAPEPELQLISAAAH